MPFHIAVDSIRRFLVVLLALAGSCCCVSFAGGFLLVDQNGVYRWDATKPIKYKVDRGGLNAAFDEQKSVDLVKSIFQRWQDVPNPGITFQYDGLLDVDVTAANASQFIRNTPDGLTPIVLDRDGSIIELLAGTGSSAFILGFASPRVIDRNSHRILEGDAVINGKIDVSPSVQRVVMLHEFGHLIGLDHTQAGVEFAESRLAGADFVANGRQYIPLMFPIIYNNGPQDLRDDDLLWLSNLYPVDFKGTATISGTVKRASGDFFPGANVVLRSADYDPPRGRVRIYSVVSDYLLQSTGEFSFKGIVPGSYELFIEPLLAQFTEGSGVGPFDSRFTRFPKDFYNGARESGDPDLDDPAEKVILNVPADGKIDNITMFSNEIPNNLVAMADDDGVAYLFPNGFKFPFYGKTYDRVFVNSDGDITFGRGEFASRERDLARFISGPPRIGGLFTDLNPEKGGEILFTQRDQSVTFTWMNVPKFSSKAKLDATDGNQFSITLFANGDVEFKYGNLKVPRAENEALVAVVGISPGGKSTPQQVDLLQKDSYVYGNTNGVVEVFNDSINLAGKRILFRSGNSAALPAQKTLVVPFLQWSRDFFTALAVSNTGNASARLSFTAYAADGRQLYSTGQSIGPTSQIARLAGELLGIPNDAVPSGWLQLKADTDTVNCLYQVGSADGRRLDGALAVAEIGTHLYLTRVFEGAGTFQGRDAQTFVSIVNPNDVTVRVVLTLFSAQGGRRSRQEIKVAPHALIFDRASNLFKDAIFPQGDGYISIQGIGGGIAAFELVGTGDAAVGLSAVAPGFARKSYSAQLAHGKSGDLALFTALNVVNTTGVTVNVSAQAFDESHQPVGRSFSGQLPGLASTQLNAGDLFGLGDARSTLVSVGSVELSAESAGVVADVLFGDASAEARFAADLPLQDGLAVEAYFSHVANGRLRPSNAASGYFTAIALYNPNSVVATVSLEDFTLPGEIKRSAPIVLQPGRRISRFLSELIPSVGFQAGGYLALKSDVGIVAQELFGNETLDFLSAVPPDIVKKTELK